MLSGVESFAEDALPAVPPQGTCCQLFLGKSRLTVNVSLLMVTDLARRVR